VILPAIHLAGESVIARFSGTLAYFFITSMFTFCISTFWLNSGGNLVCARSFWSTELAILVDRFRKTS
jgi:hypothetical protein